MIIVTLLAILFMAPFAQSSDNSSERLAICKGLALPDSFTASLNTSFLGKRQFIKVGPVNYTYFQFGALQSKSILGRPLVLIAGQGATGTIWTPDLLQILAQSRQVTVFTNRGLGLSTDAQSAQAHSITGYAESTVDLIEALQLDQPDILGWSLGGFIALTIAVEYPDMVNRVVLADTTSGGKLGTSAATAALIQSVTPILLAGMPLPPTYIFPDSVAGNAGLCRFVASIAAMPQEPVTAQQIAAQNSVLFSYFGDPDSTIFNALANITTPVLVVAGTQDQILSVQDDVALVNKISGASLLQFADAGHAAILQHAVDSADVITVFLDDE